MKIIYSVFNRGIPMEPREIMVPAVKAFSYRNDCPVLANLVNLYGQSLGAEKYCQEAFTHSSIARLEIHDGTGCVSKII